MEACLVSDPAHIVPGATGEHVFKIQNALITLDGLAIDATELSDKTYGPSTAAAVLSFKTKRQIVNRAYQTQPDDIVGKMTIAALDKEMLAREGHHEQPERRRFTYKVESVDSVVGLQQRLNNAGFDAGSEDGIYGPQTESAVRAFQRFCARNCNGDDPAIIDAGPVDGIAGTQTKRALQTYYGV